MSAPVDVRPVRSRAELMRFIRLPWRIYRNESRWVPPLIYERKAFLSREKNPFFTHAEGQLFIAWRGRTPVGRISAQIDRDFVDYQDKRWGFFGFLELVDDPEVARALFDAASAWLRERGMERVIGPCSWTMNDEAGLLVDGFEHKPMVRQSWNHPYYQALVEGAGFAKEIDLYMWSMQISERHKTLPVMFELAEKVEPEHGITTRHMRKRDLQAEVARIVPIFNEAWKRNWGFTPMREDELVHGARDLGPLLDEKWTWVAENRDGETVAFALTLKDANQAIELANGRLLPFGWVRLLLKLPFIDQVRVGFLGVRPEYQHTGVAAKLYADHFDMAERSRQKGGEQGWILENNDPMNRAMEMMGGHIRKRFRMYGKALR